MLILAFDTTSDQGGAAIHRDSDCLASVENQGGANYSVTLFEMVNGLLSKLKLRLADIDLFAVANGPGSFTGIRVGVAAAQGWAQSTGRPVCGISVLEAMIEQARPEAEWLVPMLDARRGEFVVSVFRRTATDEASAAGVGQTDQVRYSLWEGEYGSEGGDSAAGVQRVAKGHAWLLKRESLRLFVERLEERDGGQRTITCVVRERDISAQAIRALLPERIGWATVQSSLVGAIARLALARFREGSVDPPASLDALYIRRSDAEMRWSES